MAGGNNVKLDSVRTNIVMDRSLVEAALKATGLNTRRELVDFALRELLRHKQQRKLLELKGQVSWEGDLAEMRNGTSR
jgi:Arc/MetJ family transcription regulator